MRNSSDIHSFNNLFNEYYPRFVRFANGYVRDEYLSQDFVSEAFTIFWENREHLLADTNAQAYILTIVKNKCLNHLQHIKIKQRAEKEINDHAAWVLSLSINTLEACDPCFLFSDEIQQIIDKTLEKLPSKTRQIFMMNRYQGFSYKEISEQMDLSIKSIEFHISKALKQFRLDLRDFILLSPLLLYFL